GPLIWPVVGFPTPAMIFSRVDFPAPFFPIRAILSFSLMENDTSLKRVVPPKDTEILFTSITICVYLKTAAKIQQYNGGWMFILYFLSIHIFRTIRRSEYTKTKCYATDRSKRYTDKDNRQK